MSEPEIEERGEGVSRNRLIIFFLLTLLSGYYVLTCIFS